jgi:hypothetical protein
MRFSRSGPAVPFVHSARYAIASRIPQGLRQVLEETRNETRSNGIVVIENVPFEPHITHGPVEPEDKVDQKSSSISEALLVGFAAQIGEPYAVYQEGRSLINNLSPHRAHENRQTGLGYKVKLGLHIEHAAARTLAGDRAPDGLALTAISKEPNSSPATIVSDGRLALARVGKKAEKVLRQEWYRQKYPERWRRPGEKRHSLRTAIVRGDANALSFVAAFYGGMIETPNNKAAQHAVADFNSSLEEASVKVVIEPGVLVLIDNHVIFHGREAFKATFDDEGYPHRWMQRVFWTSSMRRFGNWERVSDRIVRAGV